jgi:hypothetical protein
MGFKKHHVKYNAPRHGEERKRRGHLLLEDEKPVIASEGVAI